jgi:hypothetical protein
MKRAKQGIPDLLNTPIQCLRPRVGVFFHRVFYFFIRKSYRENLSGVPMAQLPPHPDAGSRLGEAHPVGAWP